MTQQPLLTQAERDAVARAGALYTYIEANVVGHGPTRDDDLLEIRIAVHTIQRAIEAQAAAREYPAEFRLLGLVINDEAWQTGCER